MDNLAIARVLAEIGDLLEIKGENPFKIRAYRNASETVAHETVRVAGLTAAERLALPGIGKDIAAQIDRLDLDDLHARRAREAGCRIVISSDAHSAGALGQLRWGVTVARRAWLSPEDVLNTRPVDEVRRALRSTSAKAAADESAGTR